MVKIIHEHSYDPDLLPERANILDLGCRGFLFTRHMRQLGHVVAAVDIDFLIPSDEYFMCAISDFDGETGVDKSSPDQQATCMVGINKFRDRTKPVNIVKCLTLPSFMRFVGVDFFDLIKIDVEGSEYQIIMSLEKALAKQLSIEFHLHTGVYGQYEMTLMEDKLKALGYIAVKHELTSEHGAGFNYWDSLFILK